MGKFTVSLENRPDGNCRLSIDRDGRQLFAQEASVIDILVIAQDLDGDKKPDLAFQTAPSGDCCWTLVLFSLEKSPKIIGRIENRVPFAARDEDGDGVPEFWTPDGALANGFDGLDSADFPELPPIAVQWQDHKPTDVSSRFGFVYNRGIRELSSRLTPDQEEAFRKSDGRADRSDPEDVRGTKATILGIVWAYLYGGQDQAAWQRLGELWPMEDAPRIRGLLTETRAQGLRSQLVVLDSVSFVNERCAAPNAEEVVYKVGPGTTPPHATFMPDPEYSDQARREGYQGTVQLWAVITAEGCVREMKLVRSVGMGLDEQVIKAIRQWRFTPAMKDGKPVAVQVTIEVSFRLGF